MGELLFITEGRSEVVKILIEGDGGPVEIDIDEIIES
jgi:hypothetical protein